MQLNVHFQSYNKHMEYLTQQAITLQEYFKIQHIRKFSHAKLLKMQMTWKLEDFYKQFQRFEIRIQIKLAAIEK